MIDFGFRHIRTINPGQSGYSEPLGREQAEVRHDSKRYIYDLGNHIDGGLDKNLKAPFKSWVKQTFIDDSRNADRRISGTFPSYRID